jgi:hypothetical protein
MEDFGTDGILMIYWYFRYVRVSNEKKEERLELDFEWFDFKQLLIKLPCKMKVENAHQEDFDFKSN